MGGAESTPVADSKTFHIPEVSSSSSSTDAAASSSAAVVPDIPAGALVAQRFPPRRIPDEFRPTAAVVGGGIAGVHCAWELARLGFKVTVYEQYSDVGEGASRYDPGVVGRGAPFVPAVWRLNARFEYLTSLLWPFRTGVVISRETPLLGPFRESWWTWANSRKRMVKQPISNAEREQHIVSVGDELKGESADLVEALIAADPERFGACVCASSSSSSTSSVSGSGNSSSSSPAWRCIDTSRWCKQMATVLAEQYGVQFQLRNVITRLQWRVNQNFEFASSVIATDIDSRQTTAKPADLIVVAAGSMSILQRDTRANEGYALPLLSVAGYGMDLPVSRVPSLVRDELMPYQLSEEFMLRVAPTPPSATYPLRPPPDDEMEAARKQNLPPPPPTEVPCSEQRVRVAGLLSLVGDDVRRHSCDPSDCLAQLQPRVKRAAARRKRSDNDSSSGTSSTHDDFCSMQFLDADDPDSGISGFRFVRGITADGLPIVSRAGNAKNVFVVAGFGDDAALLAPGSAKWFSEMVMKTRSSSCESSTQSAGEEKATGAPGSTNNDNNVKPNPLALDRFYKYSHLMDIPMTGGEWQRKWYYGEKTLQEVGLPIIVQLWNDFKASGPFRAVFGDLERREV